jgi:alpha-D-ribose 1-methylphosphonate 5-triphosphate synthase subunit PhnL
MTVMLDVEGLAKGFVLHLQGGIHIPVLEGIALTVCAGECLVLSGPSGAGKTTLLRALYGTYRADAGRIAVRHGGAAIDLATAAPREILEVRAQTIGYVSQFLRVVPRVPARSIVAEAAPGPDPVERARALLLRLNIPTRLHALPPATFSGGEQQRVNLARGFIAARPILLLDEPTASLDAMNRDIVVGMIRDAAARGAAIVAIVHDAAVRAAIADRVFEVGPRQDAA